MEIKDIHVLDSFFYNMQKNDKCSNNSIALFVGTCMPIQHKYPGCIIEFYSHCGLFEVKPTIY